MRSAIDSSPPRFTRPGGDLRTWTDAERKQAVVDELEEHGLMLAELHEQVGRDLDPFDLICHVAFDRPLLTWRQRAERARKQSVFDRFEPHARAVLDALLDKYADEGLEPLEDPKVLTVQPLASLGTPREIIQRFGGIARYREAIRALEAELYRSA